MSARRGQVSFYVLLGVILLVGIVLAIYLFGQQRVSTDETELSAEELDDPALFAEQQLLQSRVDECLARRLAAAVDNYGAAEVQSADAAAAEADLAAAIEAEFPSCIGAFNTQTLSTGEGARPEAEVTIGTSGISVTVEYPVLGTFEDRTYRLGEFSANVDSGLGLLLSRAAAVEARLSGSPNELGLRFIDENCETDLYAFADEGVYADLVTRSDGTMVLYFYDYTAEELPEDVVPAAFELPACEGGEAA